LILYQVRLMSRKQDTYRDNVLELFLWIALFGITCDPTSDIA
jgi:hypothetical protein